MSDFDYSTSFREAGIIIFLLALFGFVSNLGVVIFIRLMPSLNNTFGVLTLSQAVADCCHQLIFAFYLAPCIFFQSAEMYAFSEQIAFASLFFYEVCGLSHVCIALNRFVAVFAPLTYSNLFNKQRTRVIVVAYWIAGLLQTTVMLKMVDCTQFLPPAHWIFAFKDTEICHIMMWYADFLKYVAYVTAVALLDLTTVLRVHYLNRKHRSGDAVSAQRRSREMNLVYQTALQGIVFMTELITYFVLSPYARNKWERFCSQPFRGVWCMAWTGPEAIGNVRSGASRSNVLTLTNS